MEKNEASAKEDRHHLKNTACEKIHFSNGKDYSYVAGNKIAVMQAFPKYFEENLSLANLNL
ncbi:MAG: hypothetical protein ON057_000433 [Glomeribacter sp. 1016415]|nr:hypothetical protein [Glomeribacter sp. 1016415]